MARGTSFVSFVTLAFLVSSEGFLWFGSRSAIERSGPHFSNPQPQPQNVWTYRDFPPQYSYDMASVSPMTVAVPVAVPVPAPMVPLTGVKDGKPLDSFQLVPCLCPGRTVDQSAQQVQQASYVVQPSPTQSP